MAIGKQKPNKNLNKFYKQIIHLNTIADYIS